jgi:trimeric autotransporter adhesin
VQNNSGDNLTLSANGPFTFAKQVGGGEAYNVTVVTAPSSPIAQTCLVWDGTGTIGEAGVTNVRVNCDLLAYYPFSGNANDESGYGHDGVVSGATLTNDRNGKGNSAYAFSNDATIQPDMPVGFLPINNLSRTLTAWLMPSQSNSEYDVIYWGAGNCTGLQFGMADQGDNAGFWGGCDDYTSSMSLPVGQWSFVAIVYSSSSPNSLTIYVNDTSYTATLTAPLMTGPSSGFFMGGTPSSSTFFTGNIDSVRVYGHALEAAEVASVRSATDP